MDGLWAEFLNPLFGLGVLEIVWINILLSGDNAVVIALAVRTLPPRQRFWGVVLGAGVAVLLRVLFTGVVAQLMAYPYLQIVGGLALFWIAIKLIVPGESHGESQIQAADNLWRAIRIIAIADIVMSLDNVIAIAAAAGKAAAAATPEHALSVKWVLIGLGLLTSIPLIVAGSALLMKLFEHFPIFIWAGAALLGWVAGHIIMTDAAMKVWLGAEAVRRYDLWASAVGALFVVAVGRALLRTQRSAAPQEAARKP